MTMTPWMLAVFAFAAWSAAAQGQYPEKPIRFIVEFPPGGASDILARRVGAKLSERLGQSVVVDNRSGAGGVIAHDFVAKAPPDGYTFLFATTSITANASLHRKLPYDARADFVPVALVCDWAGVLIVHPSVPANNLREFMQLAKANPGKLSYGSAGNGTWPHLAMEMLNHRAAVRMVHVPYKGAAPALRDVVGGFIESKIESYVTAIPHMRLGRLKAVAVTSGARMSQIPDVPTIAEQGYPGYDSAIWQGIVGPRGLPRDIVSKLEQHVAAILKLPDIVQRLHDDGMRPLSGTAGDLDALMRREFGQWQQVVRDVGITIAQ